jgi:hypothetical protein
VSAVLHWLGLDNGSGAPYLWWSGFGSDLSELAIFGAVIGGYRKHNCHIDKCWRLGKHPITGTPYTVCARHHPDVPNGGVKLSHVVSAHWSKRKHGV